MRSYLQSKAGLLLAVLVSFCIVLMLAFGWRKLGPASAQESERPRIDVVEIDDPEWQQGLNLNAMLQRSSLVIVGNSSNGKSFSPNNGQTIMLDYEVKVYEVIKGSLAPQSVVNVSLPGGMIQRQNGTLVQARTRTFRHMLEGKAYVLFLKEDPSRQGVFIPIRGPQGIYELRRTDGTVLHYGRSVTLPPDTNPPTIATFLRELRELANGNR